MLGLCAALLFGLSTPVAKRLLPATGPITAAALLYLGAGLGFLPLGRFLPRDPARRLRREDLALLAGVSLTGGAAAPALLMFGLSRLDAAPASLLLNLEAPFTIAIAVAFLGEALGPQELLGALGIVAGGLLLAGGAGGGGVDPGGALAVVGAALGWAIDNNLSQRLSARDPVQVVRVKSLAAGGVVFALSRLAGEPLPGAIALAGTLATGFVGYGISIVLHLLAIRALGAARQGTLFAVAPFAGAVAAMPVLGERLGAREWLAGAVMAAGVVVLLRGRRPTKMAA
jgi:drug/metabolite transporter (DMT)-like permease